MKDPYDVLGVDKRASQDDLKAAFRKLAAKHHPDRNPNDPGADQRFKEINAAYQLLSDPKKRAVYDRFGAAGLGATGAGNPFGGVPIDLSEINVDGIFGDLLDALGIRFGNKGDLRAEVTLTFEEAAFGVTKTVEIERVSRCRDCAGTGAEPGSELTRCDQCDGRGRVRIQQGMLPINVERNCNRCSGTGNIVKDPCKACSGAGMRSTPQKLEIELPPGIENGAVKKLDRQGDAVRGKRSGNLEVAVTVEPHPFFRRSGDNIICDLPITFAQAALGDEIEIPTLEGKGMLRVPAGTQPGTMLRIRGKGIPRRVSGRGDQLCEVQVEIPTQLNDRQKKLVMQLADELGESVQPQRRTFAEKLRGLFSND